MAKIPEAWIGEYVVLGPTENIAYEYMAKLLDVRDFGIFYELGTDSPMGPYSRVFVPWSSIRRMSLATDEELTTEMEEREDRESRLRELRGKEDSPEAP